ncbi:hypothetical protein DEU56DRAFT_753527 [Suillus clintonianus]|uniref:uncharacterized protein n=1 Tax=Suillus clintonianus TaxID=1904413 RepID=UPI001B87B7A3|nr:uncharacterized protein DEU56DRAFT_753527 [Suillus clintonianus]KAG2147707.1 hypothetical protein DEU56DRAFT_753527 [Suillus clintonianus]
MTIEEVGGGGAGSAAGTTSLGTPGLLPEWTSGTARSTVGGIASAGGTGVMAGRSEEAEFENHGGVIIGVAKEVEPSKEVQVLCQKFLIWLSAPYFNWGATSDFQLYSILNMVAVRQVTLNRGGSTSNLSLISSATDVTHYPLCWSWTITSDSDANAKYWPTSLHKADCQTCLSHRRKWSCYHSFLLDCGYSNQHRLAQSLSPAINSVLFATSKHSLAATTTQTLQKHSLDQSRIKFLEDRQQENRLHIKDLEDSQQQDSSQIKDLENSLLKEKKIENLASEKEKEASEKENMYMLMRIQEIGDKNIKTAGWVSSMDENCGPETIDTLSLEIMLDFMLS